MTYGLNPRLFVENGPAVEARRASTRSSTAGFRAWRSLSENGRIALVDRALQAPANDLIDAYPIAL
jgi:hypothetical protein